VNSFPYVVQLLQSIYIPCLMVPSIFGMVQLSHSVLHLP
jgi:hypothetical protein